jgi:hypothetical protein
MVLVACGRDDGADVRSTGTASGSGSATGTASGSGTGHATGVAPECRPINTALEPDSIVAVTLNEWSLEPATEAIEAGAVRFELDNIGAEPHEFAIARAASAEDLPLADDGTVDLDALGDDFIGEVEPFPAGETCQGVFELEPGDYVLFCNILEEHDGELENHFELGMHTELRVVPS